MNIPAITQLQHPIKQASVKRDLRLIVYSVVGDHHSVRANGSATIGRKRRFGDQDRVMPDSSASVIERKADHEKKDRPYRMRKIAHRRYLSQRLLTVPACWSCNEADGMSPTTTLKFFIVRCMRDEETIS